MANRKAKLFETVSYRNAAGETTDVAVTGIQQAAPGQPASSTSTTGGTLAAATYSYRVSAVIDGVETAASVAKTQVTTGTTSTVTVDWTTIAASAPYSRATAFKVYGRTGGSELLMSTTNMPTTTFVDTGSVTPSGALPADTGAIRFKNFGTKTVQTQVPMATAVKQTNVYYNV